MIVNLLLSLYTCGNWRLTESKSIDWMSYRTESWGKCLDLWEEKKRSVEDIAYRGVTWIVLATIQHWV